MYNYFNFNGVQVNDLALVTKIEKPYIPERTINTINVTSRDGEIFDGMKYNAIKIPISLAIIGNDEEDYELRVKILRDTFKVRNEVPIGFADNTSIYGMLSSEFKVQKKNAVTGYADIEIICNNPYTYSDHTLTFEAEEGHKEVIVEHNGGVDALPLVSVGFTKDTHFAQIENMATGERVLVGDYPKLVIGGTTPASQIILRDPCESLSGLTIGGANIDANRSTNGSFGITEGGNSYKLSSMGDGNTTYKGACGRITLSSGVDQFKLRVKMQHNSKGKNGDPNKYDADVEKHKELIKSGKKEPYYKVTCTGLHYRSGPGTNYKSYGTLKKGFEIYGGTIEKGWCKFKYKNKTCYCSAKDDYLTKMVNDTTTSEWKTFTIENVWVMPESGNKTDARRAVFSKANSSSKIVGYIPYGSKIRVLLKPENQLDKHGKVKNTFYQMWKPFKDSKGNKIKGYIEKAAIKRAFDMDANSVKYEDDPGYADDKLGTVEVYGFNTNGNQLFKLCMFDDNPYFEYTQPQVRIGNRVVLKDTSKTPKPKPKTEASQNQTTVSYYLSGKHGDWNDFIGWFTLTRKKVGNQYVWDVEVTKEKDGNIVNRQASKNLKYTDLPTDELSYLAIYIGTNAATMNKCSAMCISHIEVQSLTPKTSTEQDVTYFKEGDVLDLDFENSNCYLNRELRNDLVDIGSTYFSIDPGETEIVVNSDDTNASLSVAVKEKWVGVVDEDIATTPKYD